MTNKKDVHRTGALASILNQSDVPAVDLHRNKIAAQVEPVNLAKSLASHSADTSTKKMDALVELTPDSCKPWDFSDRLDVEMGNIDDLANSIQQAGQQEPILVRQIKHSNLPNDTSPRYEIIFGNRRWRACKQIGKNILAIIRDLSDQEAALAQKEENENRQDIGDYSKAIHYKRLIDAGVFSNESQLAQKLHIHRNSINNLMSYNRIPDELLKAIPNVHNLAQRLAVKLASLAKNPDSLEILIQLAQQIGSNKLTSANIETAVNNFKTDGNSITTNKKSMPVIGKGGAEIFTIREDSNGAPCIVLHKVSRQAINIDDLKTLIKSYIDRCIENSFSDEPV
jgi:ParB family chromosome partitioning protein